MPTIGQLAAASYPAVLNEKRKAANQWAESAFLREAERQKMIKRESFGTILEHTLDYQRNPGATTLATDLTTVSLAKVEVLTAAQFDIGQLSVPMVWSKADEGKNSGENQKVDFVENLLTNGIDSHDDLLEEVLFSTTTDGILGLQTLIPDSGQGSPGGIDASIDAFWRNTSLEYNDDGSDLDAILTEAFNTVAKGSGGLQPTLIVSGAGPIALYEEGQQDNRRYIDTKEADAGFKQLAFKTARWVFSQYGGTRIYGLNPKVFRINVSRDFFRAKGDVIEIPNMNGYVMKLFSMVQTTTNNKSRLFVLTEGA